MRERVSVIDAAKEIGCSPHAVRIMMRKGKWDLGEVMTPEDKGGSSKCTYYIFRNKLDVFLGKTDLTDLWPEEGEMGYEED